MCFVRFQFLFCHPPLPDVPHPPTREGLVECVKLRRDRSLATFYVIVRQLCSCVNKGQAVWFGLAWLPAVCEKQTFKLPIFLSSHFPIAITKS